MCLAVPAKVVEAKHGQATVDMHGNRVVVSTSLVPGVTAGDWVLLHAGFALQRLEPEEAKATWSVLADLRAMAEEASP